MFLFKGQKIAKFLKVGSRKKRKDTLEGLACTFYSGYHIVNILGFLGQLSLFKYSTLPPQRKSSYRRNIHELCDFSNKTLSAKTESRLALAHRLQLPILQFLGHKVWFREQLQLPSIPRSYSGPGRQVGIKVKVMLDRVTLDLVALIHQRWEQVPENQEAI